jgi:4-amino-4-deoxy-L-arabinose transferase-like glycosyltransferase
VVPWFNGEPRYDKPPLIYWAQILCYQVLGETAFSARLPSALFATGASLLIFFWARRLTQPRTALAAAVVFTTCMQMAVHARLAVADMPMIFFVCAALWSGWESTRPEAPSRWRWWWVFYVSLALGFLAKGPVAWLPLGGLILGKWFRPQQFTLTPGRSALGMSLTLGIVALWGIPALEQTHGEFLKVGVGYHVIGRSLESLDGHGARSWLGWVGTSPYYLLTFFFSFCPWAFRVPQGLRNWWPARQQDVFGWYLLTQAGLVFAVFTIVRTKLPHYTLPAFPCLAIWLAKAGEDGLLKHLRVARQAIVMAALILTITIAGGLAIRPHFVARALFEKARPQLTPAMKFASLQSAEPSLVWEFRQVLTNHLQELTAPEAVDFMRGPGPSLLIVPTGFYETNSVAWGTNLSVVQVRGMNWATFSPARLTALIRP